MGLKKVLETVKKNPPLTLTNCVGGEKIDVDTLQGYSKQNVYSGKNLLNSNSSYVATENTRNGVTIKPLGDGTFKLSGTATANTYIPLQYITLPIGQYKMVGCPSGGSNESYKMSGYQNNASWVGFEIGNGKTFTVTDDTYNSSNRIEMVIPSGTVCNNLIFKPMVVDTTKYPNESYDTYEPYVGGIPAPNPQYPQEIKSCGDIINLLDNTATSKTVSGITFTVNDDKSVTASGTASATAVLSINCNLTIDKSFKIVGCPSNGSSTTYAMNIQADGTWGKSDIGNGYVHNGGGTVTTINIAIYSGQTVNNLIFKPMITTNTSLTYENYAPYGSVIQFVESGKNLLNPKLKKESFDLTGTGTIRYGYSFPSGTYSLTNTNANNLYYRIPKADLTDRGTTINIGINEKINNIIVDSSHILWLFAFDESTDFSGLMLEKNTQATTFEEYKNQVINLPLNAPLRSIGDIKDEIITDEEGVKKIVRRIGSVDLGSLTWTYTDDWNGSPMFSSTSLKNIIATSGSYDIKANVLCSDYENKTRNQLYNNASDGFAIGSVAGTALVRDSSISSTDKPSGIIIYELVTPTTEELTTSQKTELDKLVSFEDTTYFSVDSGLLTIKYYAYANVFWEEPKTNWQSTDYINYIDYERIKDNVIYIGGMARSMYANIPSEIEMPSKQSYSAIPYASDWNAIENNIDNINRGSLKMDIGTTKVFQANGFFINYEELNRVENATEMLYEALKINYDLLPKLSYRLGSPKFKF